MKKNWRLLTFADWVMLVVILLLTVSSYFFIVRKRNTLNAHVFYRNALIGVFNLRQNRTIAINENCKAEIKDGKIRMLSSDCPDKRCLKQGWNDFLPIICLPNQIMVEIKEDGKKRRMHLLY